MRRVLVLGAKGRLGAALVRKWSRSHTVIPLARPDLDVADSARLEHLLENTDYDAAVNCTGLTNVDRCESARDEAEAVNATAPAVMARDAARRGARLLHISTDYVFDGEKPTPYIETDDARPLGWYGATKLAGEQAVLDASPRHSVFRISWVFGPEKQSFVDMIVDRAAKNDRVEAIADKISCPTFTDDCADWLESFVDNDLAGGLYHACNHGACTWQEYGQHALDCVAATVLLRTRTVEPILLADMTAFVAPRPRLTPMDTSKLERTTGLKPRPWQDALAEYIAGRRIFS